MREVSDIRPLYKKWKTRCEGESMPLGTRQKSLKGLGDKSLKIVIFDPVNGVGNDPYFKGMVLPK